MFFNRSPKFSAAVITNMGKIRTNNEDNFYFDGKTLSEETVNAMTDDSIIYTIDPRREGGLFCVCDGMGGESYGEIASRVAVETLCEHKEKFAGAKKGQLKDIITAYTDEANSRICDKITELSVKRIGTTYTLLYFVGSTAYISNIGDSRAYLIRDDSIKQLSRDHTEVAYYVSAGIITEEEARNHPMRHGLTQHLGIFPDDMILSPYFAQVVQAKAGDTFVLCSDGLTDMLEDDKIKQIVKDNFKDGSKAIVQSLADAALEAGGRDNVTVIAVTAK